MTLKGIAEVRENYLRNNWEYQRCYYIDFNYAVLENCLYKKSHKKAQNTYNDITMMIDTETSKNPEYVTPEEFDYKCIYEDVKSKKFKTIKYKEVGTKHDLYDAGIHFGGNCCIDSYYEELKSDYPYIFTEDAYSDIQALEYIYDYLVNKKPKERDTRPHNHVVIWTLSIRLFDINIATLYGRKPSELIDCLNLINQHLEGDKTIYYIHNLSYDWVFLRKFFFAEYGLPVNQLNVKSHYPINIEFENGITLRDSLILFQRSLEKTAKDFNVEHQKAVGDWDYDEIRHQNTDITDDELHYAEFDTLAGVESIDALKAQLGKDTGTLPFTSTGILRELIKKEGAKNHAKDWFNKNCPSWNQYQKMVKMYHGGFTHGNRHYLDLTLPYVKSYDFASSYPFVLFFKYPSGKFVPIKNKSVDYILKNKNNYAFMFKLIATGVELKDENNGMPFLQYSKCEYEINSIVDNGRILASDYIEIYLNEIDLDIIAKQYNMKGSICVEVEATLKDYLPRWFTDIVFQLFTDKTKLKHVDDILYTIQKYKLNACYGLCCQRWEKPLITETEEGEYIEDESISPEELFNKHIKKRSTILPYFVGCWCTSYAVHNLFELGSMCKVWLYSDTDSCYGLGWDKKKVQAYNNRCKDFMKMRGYGGVEHKGKVYWLGVAEGERDGNYYEYRYLGAKRYCGRCMADNEIHITVAGVPKKKGAKALKSVDEFTKGFTFDGEITGKKTHTHIYVDEIFTDEYGNECGDSIDLSPCDYLLDSVQYHSLMEWVEGDEEIIIQVAEDMEDLQDVI